MALSIDVVAPMFKEVDVFDRTINLSDYKGKKVLIGFFRHAGCPFCNMRVHALTKVHQEFKDKGLEMIFFFESTKETILRSTFHKDVSPIPIISDPEKKWYNAYGLEESFGKSAISHVTSFIQTTIKAKIAKVPLHLMKDGESFSTMPAEFLIDEGLIIRTLHYSQRLNDRMNLDAIKEFANQ